MVGSSLGRRALKPFYSDSLSQTMAIVTLITLIMPEFIVLKLLIMFTTWQKWIKTSEDDGCQESGSPSGLYGQREYGI